MKRDSADGVANGPDSSERLDGWKEIAVFLKRDVRTVRRWEEQEELPIHRHVHMKRASVYAYPTELSAWWNNRHERLNEPQKIQQSRLRRNLPRVTAMVAVIFLALIAWLVQGWWGARTPHTLEFHERDWVLITDFENRTGEALFDGSLKYAMAQELASSPYVNVVPQSRVEDVLQLMKKPPDTKVDGALAREICLRDGGIKAFLTGKVEQLGSTYVISAALAAVPDGRIVTSHTEEAADPNLVWPAIRALSHWARGTLGEALPLIQQNTDKLEEVTTPSLLALQLFSRGDSLHHRGMYKPAAELYRQALEEDPDFAVAHMWLAFVLKNQGLPQQEWMPHVERAVELSENGTEAERCIILGKSHYIQRNLEEALPYYEALLQLDPDHYWGLDTLRIIYLSTGRTEQAVGLAVHAASLRPNDFFTHLSTTRILAAHRGIAQAEPYALRASKLMTDEIQRRASFQCAWIQLFPAQVCWSEGDYRGALGEIERHVDGLETLDEATQGDLGEHCSYLYLALGKLQAVREIAKQLPQRSRARTMANLSLFLDEYSSMGRTVSYLDRNNLRQDLILALARAGYVVEAEAMFSRLADRRSRASGTSASVEAMLGVVEAELALARGNEVHAIKLLERSLGLYETAPSFYPSPLYFFGCQSLARSLEMRGDAEGAIRVMQNGSRPEWQHPYPTGPYPWIKHKWLLASLYRRLGDHHIAREIEAELLKLLVYADADHPMLVQLKAREEADRPEA